MFTIMERISRLVVLLIKPTTYDDDGRPIRFRRGAFPTNSLGVMRALTLDAIAKIKADKTLPITEGEVQIFDDAVWRQRVDDPAELVKKYQDGRTQVVVGFVAVQTNQFPRAANLAKKFQAAGAQVVFGGFHVSGSISVLLDGVASFDSRRSDVPCPGIMPPEIQGLMDKGIIVCHGEAERIWTTILKDILGGVAKDKTLYRGGQPDFTEAPLPEYPAEYLKSFATSMRAVDTSRGCPWQCDFCTIINVQGGKVRCRNPQRIIELMKKTCEEEGRAHFFFTDDNLSRNPLWEELFDGLIALRDAGYQIEFMCQADLNAFKTVPRFLEKLAKAGCTQVFLGVETLNPVTLKEIGKVQNKPEDYQELCENLHRVGIIVQAAYIIGFDADTPENLLEHVRELKELGFDQVSFYILTPLPGSEFHVRKVMAGVKMDNDFARFDSSHAVMDHPEMSRQELEEMLPKCFREFCRIPQMITALRRIQPTSFWGLFLSYVWYRNGFLGEGVHPMTCGFWSVRQRLELRPGYSQEGFWRFWAKEFWHRLKYVGHLFHEFYVFQHVYFEVRLKEEIAGQLSRRIAKTRGWWSHIFRQPNRRWLNAFWIRYGKQKWNLFWKPHWHIRMLPFAVTEVIYTFYWGMIIAANFRTIRTAKQ